MNLDIDFAFKLFGWVFQFYFHSEAKDKSYFGVKPGTHTVHWKWFFFGWCTRKTFDQEVERILLESLMTMSPKNGKPLTAYSEPTRAINREEMN